MKKLLAIGALALGLSGCATVPADGYYGYGPGYGTYYDPYPYWGYGFGYAPYFWGPPVLIGGTFFFHDGRGFHHGFRGDGHHWSGNGGSWNGGGWGGHHGGRGGGR